MCPAFTQFDPNSILEDPVFLETDRFLIGENLANDVKGFFEPDANTEVHLYLGNKPVTSREQVIEVIANVLSPVIENDVTCKHGEALGYTEDQKI